MTAKRNFKRRVRQRQARTGESYVTARRRVLAGRPEPGAPPGDPDDPGRGERTDDTAMRAAEAQSASADEIAVSMSGQTTSVVFDVAYFEAAPQTPTETEPVEEVDRPTGGISVIELVDVSEEARRFGLVCRVLMFPALAERMPPARVLGRLRELLVATVGDPGIAMLAGLALAGQKPPPRRVSLRSYQDIGRFLQRARAGLGGTFDDGSTLAFHVADGDGIVPILCALSAQDTAIELSAIDDVVPARWEPLAALIEQTELPEPSLARREFEAELAQARRRRPKLFLLHDGKRYPITKDELVIGRSRTAADLVIHDESGLLSRRHAVVIHRAGSYYLKDLGSSNGVIYKGMRIDNKRIDEGDVFAIAGHEIAFTFREE